MLANIRLYFSAPGINLIVLRENYKFCVTTFGTLGLLAFRDAIHTELGKDLSSRNRRATTIRRQTVTLELVVFPILIAPNAGKMLNLEGPIEPSIRFFSRLFGWFSYSRAVRAAGLLGLTWTSHAPAVWLRLYMNRGFTNETFQ